MIPIALKVLTVVSCVSIVLMGLFMAINKMGTTTSHIVRLAWILITCGAFGVALAQIFNTQLAPGLYQTMAWCGTAMFLAFDRRKHFLPNLHRPTLAKTHDSAN